MQLLLYKFLLNYTKYVSHVWLLFLGLFRVKMLKKTKSLREDLFNTLFNRKQNGVSMWVDQQIQSLTDVSNPVFCPPRPRELDLV